MLETKTARHLYQVMNEAEDDVMVVPLIKGKIEKKACLDEEDISLALLDSFLLLGKPQHLELDFHCTAVPWL
jgi:hypothetical protein